MSGRSNLPTAVTCHCCHIVKVKLMFSAERINLLNIVLTINSEMEDSEELNISQKSWKRFMDPVEKDGFREGFEKGRESTFQEGFNIGFKQGFKYAYEKAIACGKTRLTDDSYKERMEDIDGVCIICSEPEEHIQTMSVNELIENQEKVYN